MKLFHHNLEIELNDTWWAESKMKDFMPKSSAYRVDLNATKGLPVFEVSINEVRPVKRNPGVGIFNDSAEASANSRSFRYRLQLQNDRCNTQVLLFFGRRLLTCASNRRF